MIMSSLWQSEPVREDAPVARPVSSHVSPFTPRDYQAADADAIEAAWDSGRESVLCVQATGLGKSVMAAEIARRGLHDGKTLVIVDSSNLAKDLYSTIMKHTGVTPGIITGDHKNAWGDRPIVVATKQCLCSGRKVRRYEHLDPREFSRVVVDECESALADGYAELMVYLLEGNPDIKIVGLTATPLPSKKKNIRDLFAHAVDEPGPLYRDLQWAYLNGWLVKPMQAMLHCSMDFSSVKITSKDGEKDYSDKDLTRMMMDQGEQEWAELGGGIYQICKEREAAIVVCPNKTKIADKLAGYIEGAARADGAAGFCEPIHRKLPGTLADDRMADFKAGKFKCAVSVKMFEKGFDYDKVDTVVIVRRTKSLRLYTQLAGRGTRPLSEIRAALQAAGSADERMCIIRESAKPSMMVVDCVGVSDEAKDILGVIDILGRGIPENIRERVRKNLIERAKLTDHDAPDPEPVDMGDEARSAIRDINADEEERRKREAISARVSTTLEIDNNGKRFNLGQGANYTVKPVEGKSVALLKRNGFNPDRMDPVAQREACRDIIARAQSKPPRLTVKQERTLSRFGFKRDQLAVMPKSEATKHIDIIAANGWKRTKAGAA